jgi:hypothetical protein
MKNMKQWIQAVLVALLACSCMQMTCKTGNKQGSANTTFNRRFIPTIKPAMTYEQIAQIAGAPGVKIGENNSASPPEIQYRWNGGKDSILTVKFAGNKMVEAAVRAPNGHTYLIQNNGEVVDITE